MQLEAIMLQEGRGAIVATESTISKHPILLPIVFSSSSLADLFLSACERTGVCLFPEMGYHSMKQLFDLWHDSFKRPR